MKEVPFVYPEYGGTEEYTAYLQQIADDDVCPFCKDNLSTYHKQPIIKKFDYWLLTTNQHRGSRFLIILRRHASHIEDLTPLEFSELRSIFRFVVGEYKLEGATLMIRSGHPKNTGGTVGHLHAQIVSGNPNEENYSPIITRIG